MGTSPRYTGIYIMKFTVVGRRRGGRLPREPQPGRIENMRKKYSQDSGEPGRGGVCEFYILPGYRGRRGGGGRRMRRRSSPSRREKNSRLGKPSTLKQRCKLLFGASARKRSYPTYRNRAAKAGREFTFQGVERGETNVPGLSSRS